MFYAKLKWKINFTTLHAEITVQNTLECLKVNTAEQSVGRGGCMT